jgi:hypothetical protein
MYRPLAIGSVNGLPSSNDDGSSPEEFGCPEVTLHSPVDSETSGPDRREMVVTHPIGHLIRCQLTPHSSSKRHR